MLDWLNWLEATALARLLREDPWIYPFVEIGHLVGITVLVGPAVLWDLRLLGVARRLPVRALAAYLLRTSYVGLALATLSGLLLLLAGLSETLDNPAFRLKLALLAIAIGNALLFQRGIGRTVISWDTDVHPPLRAKLAAVVSLLAWLGVIACGRLIAYS
jgi:hypothetical protein